MKRMSVEALSRFFIVAKSNVRRAKIHDLDSIGYRVAPVPYAVVIQFHPDDHYIWSQHKTIRAARKSQAGAKRDGEIAFVAKTNDAVRFFKVQ